MNEDDLKFITSKKIVLSSPGKLLNDAYYSTDSVKQNFAETTYGTKFRQSLGSLQIGGTSSFSIPARSLLSNIYLSASLPNPANDTDYIRAWLLASIASIEYTFLGNTSSTLINGTSMLHLMAQECETSEKLLFLLNKAGQTTIAPGGAQAAVPTEAVVLLPLPFSCQSAGGKKPFDSSLLNAQVHVKINFHQPNRFCVGNNAANYPQNFTRLEVFQRTGDFSYQSMSLMTKLIKNPEYSYNYPMYHVNSFVSGQFVGVTEAGGYRGCNVQLSGFISADLLGVIVSVIRTSFEYNNAGITNPFVFDDIKNLAGSVNGTLVYDTKGRECEILNCISKHGGSLIPYDRVTGFGNNRDTDPVHIMPIFIDFTRRTAGCSDAHMENTRNLANQQLNLSFNTSTGAADTYRLHATYIYNACIEVKDQQATLIT